MSKYSWQDCPAVVALSEYIKSNKHNGFSLVLQDGAPTIHCAPGVTPADAPRWEALNMALGLLRAADQDLKHLIANRMIKIPGHPGYR